MPTPQYYLNLAEAAVLTARKSVHHGRLSHVALRSADQEEWQTFMALFASYGDVHMTFKPDGRQVPFIKLTDPLLIGQDLLEYLELPAPKPMPVDEPAILVAIKTEYAEAPLITEGLDIRQQTMHAEDFIARDKHRTA